MCHEVLVEKRRGLDVLRGLGGKILRGIFLADDAIYDETNHPRTDKSADDATDNGSNVRTVVIVVILVTVVWKGILLYH